MKRDYGTGLYAYINRELVNNLIYVSGRRISMIDKILLNVKLPCETSRNTRSITERSYYKAKEYRNILFYLAFGIFKDILPDLYLKNLMKYIIFIRILCQDGISLDEINDSILIIQSFLP